MRARVKTQQKNDRFLRFNWVSSLLASLILWGFVAAVLIDDKENSTPKLPTDFWGWTNWITVNFTWFYILTQDVWFIFVIWLLFTKYANIKLGKDDEKPEFSDFAWFSMLFSCGIGVGLYYWGVAEPIRHYRLSGNMQKMPVTNDDQKAQQAIFQTLFHWGLHGWIPYIVIALTLGVVCHRQGLPMTMRNAFHPLIGDHTKGFAGDVIDALSISCTTFGVCTSLGLGCAQINAVLARMDGSVAVNEKTQTGIIWIITSIAVISVLLGLKRGIKTLSLITFTLGLILMVLMLVCDNTWYLLNSFVEAVGVYMTWVIQVGFNCGTWTQLNREFGSAAGEPGFDYDGKSKLWGKASLSDKLFDATNITTTASLAQAKYDSPSEMMNGWTIFYWGWWISWAPFVGMFIAKISKGRTVGQVIKGAFIAPVLFSFLWLTIFGSLGIKMQRASEMALDVAVDKYDWSIDCATHYTDNAPSSEKAMALADKGYYLLSCRGTNDRILDVMEPYGKLTPFMHLLTLVGITLYFVTSSDSGSFVDDIISAQGHENPPWIQRVYWAVTEGATAQALLSATDSGLSTIQAVSIVAGLPYTIAICYCCTSLYRALKREMRDEDIMSQRHGFVVSSLDILELYSPEDMPAQSPSSGERFKSNVIALFFPYKGLKTAACAAYGDDVSGTISAVVATCTWFTWFLCLCLSGIGEGTASIAWMLYVFFFAQVAIIRYHVRAARSIRDNFLHDLFASCALYPMVISQMELEAPYIEQRKQV